MDTIIKQMGAATDFVAIFKKTGYNVQIPEQKEIFYKTLTAVCKLMRQNNYLQTINHKGIYEIYQTDDKYLSFYHIRKFISEITAVNFAVDLLTELRSMLNIKNNITDEQIQITASIIVNDMPYCQLTLADLKLCFKFIITGKFGKLYDRLDPSVIFDCINQYRESLIYIKK